MTTLYKPGCTQQIDTDPLPKSYVIAGQYGAGKTRLAATWSEDCPEQLPAKEMTVLKGMVWLLADEGGLDTLYALNLRPEFVIDLPKLVGGGYGPKPSSMSQAFEWVVQELKLFRSQGADKVVVDTITNLQSLNTIIQFMDPNASANPQRVWGEIGQAFGYLRLQIQLLGFRTCWLAHPAENTETLNAEDTKNKAVSLVHTQKASDIAQGTAHDGLVRAGIATKIARSLTKGGSSFLGWIKVETSGVTMKRVLLPFGDGNLQSKNRYEHLLDKKEEPNLQKLEQKILAKLKGQK